MKGYGFHWFRRDLRITGNPALQWSWKRHQGRVVGLFFFDKKFLSRPDFSTNRFQFFLHTLRKLKAELKAVGSDLLFFDIGPFEGIQCLFDQLDATNVIWPETISWNRDYESFARDRDLRMENFLKERGIDFHTDRDHLLLEPHELFKNEDPEEGYQVYTPFSKRWKELFQTQDVQFRITSQKKSLNQFKSNRSPDSKLFDLSVPVLGVPENNLLETYLEQNSKRVTIPIPETGLATALERLRDFKTQISNYATNRDVPSIDGTSGLSIFFKNGSLTVPQVIAALGLEADAKNRVTGQGKFLNELIWREFYYHILWRHPHVENQSFQSQYDRMPWDNREDYFQAWKSGLTGFPVVDAGMRQLNETGWMHNRVRMIVASFLTKDLLVDWRWGERFFMEKLLDGDLAPNNGGWQWAASTGCDPQPYFRIFNPILQSKKFDPEGSYIKRFVPELQNLGPEDIHEPPHLLRGDYPQPIVNHFEQREKALAMYQRISGKEV